MVTRSFDPDDDFPFSEPADRAGAPPPPPRPPGGAPGDPAARDRAPAGEAERTADPGEGASAGAGRGGRAGDADPWERVREAAWRVGQRARRHERVLHTRISHDLAQDLRRAADDLRVPVSNLVRNVLEEAFGAVERVSDEVGGFLEDVLAEADGPRSDLRRLRRHVRRLARRGRRRAFRGDPSEEELDDEADEGERFASDEAADADDDEAFAARGGDEARHADGAGDESARAERAREAVREAGAPGEVFRPRGAEMAFPEVLGWQPLRLNAAASCACGERQLAAGEEAFVAVTERGFARAFLCGTCMRARGGA